MALDDKVTMSHGSGGEKTRDLIRDVFLEKLSNPALNQLGDSAIISMSGKKLAYTTDSYVINPIFFPGGDIGKLSICGTINDLAVAGAKAIYLSSGFIIEEGFSIEDLRTIASSMAEVASKTGVKIVTGDTKVVEHGKCDGVFINTSGIGEIFTRHVLNPNNIRVGDAILINGYIADHGTAIMCTRDEIPIRSDIESDCAPLGDLAERLASAVPDIRFMRDATRGGLAMVMCEIAEGKNFGIELVEDSIPLRDETSYACELLGIDPIYVANEGKLIAIIPESSVDNALAVMHAHNLGKNATVIGRVKDTDYGRVWMKTTVGSKRAISMPSGNLLPRIC